MYSFASTFHFVHDCEFQIFIVTGALDKLKKNLNI